jgi:hypothetical protein
MCDVCRGIKSSDFDDNPSSARLDRNQVALLTRILRYAGTEGLIDNAIMAAGAAVWGQVEADLTKRGISRSVREHYRRMSVEATDTLIELVARDALEPMVSALIDQGKYVPRQERDFRCARERAINDGHDDPTTGLH